MTTSFNLRKITELLSATQEDPLKAFVGGTLPRSTRQIGTWIEKAFGAPRIELRAMCLMVVKLAGASSVRTRHSSSRKIKSMTQWRLFSMAQCARTTGPSWAAGYAKGAM